MTQASLDVAYCRFRQQPERPLSLWVQCNQISTWEKLKLVIEGYLCFRASSKEKFNQKIDGLMRQFKIDHQDAIDKLLSSSPDYQTAIKKCAQINCLFRNAFPSKFSEPSMRLIEPDQIAGHYRKVTETVKVDLQKKELFIAGRKFGILP
jgi:hypothetical protein